MSDILGALARGYQRVVSNAAVFLPLAGIVFFALAAAESDILALYALHRLSMGIAVVGAAFIACMALVCFRRDGEMFMRHIALGYLAFACIYAPHVFLALLDDSRPIQCLLFEHVARLVALSYFFLGIFGLQRRQTANLSASQPRSDIWLHVLGFVILAAALYGVSERGGAQIWVVKTVDILALMVSCAAIWATGRLPEQSALTRCNRLAQIFFAEASLAFLLSTMWDLLWWFAHALSIVAFITLGYGVSRALLRNRSYAHANEGEMQQDVIEKIIEFSPVGILLVDAELRHMRCNQMFEGMLGTREAEAHMPTLLDYLRLSGAQFVEEMNRSPMLIRHFDTPMGRHYEVRIARAAVAGRTQAFVCILIDRSSAHKAEEEIRALNQNLENEVAERSAANADLETFVYSVSHDLRAPLRAIVGFSHILDEEHQSSLGEEGRFLLSKISSSAHNMRQLIDDLLSFARLGRVHVSRAPFDMSALVEDVVQEVRAQTGLHATEVEIGKLPSVSGDRALLMQVWVNLIGNAFKFSARAEKPKIRISAVSENGEHIYRISDNGVGFDMRFVDKLFAIFQRLHKQSEFEGTGVGLAISQRIVQKHGGRMYAESSEGEGAAFYFTLPAEQKKT